MTSSGYVCNSMKRKDLNKKGEISVLCILQWEEGNWCYVLAELWIALGLEDPDPSGSLSFGWFF